MSTTWKHIYGAIAVGCIAVFTCDAAFGQRGRDGGREGGGGGRAAAGGGGRVAAQGGGGGARVSGGGQAGGGARVATPGGGGARISAGGQAGGGARVAQPRTGGAAAGARVAAPGAGANIRTPAASGGADVRLPTTRGGATVEAPGIRAGAQTGAGATAGANIRAPRAAAGADVDGDARTAIRPGANRANIGADIDGRGRVDVDGDARTTLRPNLDNDAIDGRGRVDVDGAARARADGARIRSDATARATTDFRPNWARRDAAQLSGFRSTFGNAINARVAADRAARAAYWGDWGGRVRNGFYFGNSPYFNDGFWVGRNMIGFGYGPSYGYAPGGWWGYSPWVGNRPWNYWYGNPGWNTFAGIYGWNTPIYYDYGPYGNVVYRSNRVYVNEQPVGTAEDYAQSAAELAMVTEEQMNAAHDWMPLGTFSVATSQEETNPVRVAQLAYDNKQGLISGTIFNRESNNLYTLQGKVDPKTQRVAFTVGKDPNVVMETGLYNLTQNETPVLVHFGPNKTATYLFARLPEPQSDGATTTATVPPAEDLRR
jgi:hypothetical protein